MRIGFQKIVVLFIERMLNFQFQESKVFGFVSGLIGWQGGLEGISILGMLRVLECLLFWVNGLFFFSVRFSQYFQVDGGQAGKVGEQGFMGMWYQRKINLGLIYDGRFYS